LLCGQRTAGASQRQPDLELPCQRQAEKEKQPGHQRQKYRRLKLESPAQRRPRRAQPQQHGHQHPERDENASGVDESMGAQLVPLLAAGVDQRQTLEKEHREDAGHEVQEQAAEKRQAGGAQ
jgi:hypothetical protein